ncbi:hypothetical protein [Halapricum salinum]|uniref:VWFA domain-containing protein n=1 Tax=Halapricum salinum TaxID=1457250 RepID=A0A4D6HF51_9EURY|nr:hypothetical protein [Halapricum salinum]QCC52649.1 hypothetical protein DV733_16045 [Halapricum salinum]
MSDDKSNLSRRKLLGGLGTIGAAGAFGGAATTSLLWDEEKFGNASNPNVLQAGALDLAVDWEEHYVDWLGAETEYDVRRIDSLDDLQEGEAYLPPNNPMIAVPQEDFNALWLDTIIEEQDLVKEEAGPDSPNDQPDPVVTLEDVKPGDFGEVTFSYHLFGNPGFVSMCGEVHADVDNGLTEPEDKVNGHTPDESDGTEGGDLGDHIQAKLFYDRNCDNLHQGGEIEVMFVTDVSESMGEPFSGTPDVDDNPGDANQAGDNTRLEAIKAHMGDHPALGSDVDLLSEIASCGGGNIEVGSVSTAVNLHHLDNLDDGDDDDGTQVGFDDGGLDANLDRALTAANAGDDDGNTAADYEDLKNLFGPDTDFSPDFVTEDPVNNTGGNEYEAERPYTEDGGTAVPAGIERAHRALLPDAFVSASSGKEGIDPSGNAAFPGEVRKLIVVFTDGKPGETTLAEAQQTADDAQLDSVDILPVIVNADPSGDDVDYANALATEGLNPLFAANYSELGDAIETVQTVVCSSAGGEEIIAGPMPINELIGGQQEGDWNGLEDCVLLRPDATGIAAAEQFGQYCQAPSNTGCVAMEWWLPYDIPGVNDNIVQTDRLEFQVSFEAVQCRHNTNEDGMPVQTLPGADAENNAQHYANDD